MNANLTHSPSRRRPPLFLGCRAPAGPRPASISPCRTQLRSAVSVRSSSRATAATDLPLSRTIWTACALNSFVNARRLRLAMTHSYRTFVRSGVSTKPGQVQFVGADAEDLGEADDELAVEAKLPPLVVGDDGLGDAEALGELDLGEPALPAQP